MALIVVGVLVGILNLLALASLHRRTAVLEASTVRGEGTSEVAKQMRIDNGFAEGRASVLLRLETGCETCLEAAQDAFALSSDPAFESYVFRVLIPPESGGFDLVPKAIRMEDRDLYRATQTGWQSSVTIVASDGTVVRQIPFSSKRSLRKVIERSQGLAQAA